MTNSQSREWVTSTLSFWKKIKPSKLISAARIACEIEHLTLWFEKQLG
jgi:hypothetical protein